jgi:hypothetical protein
MPPRTSPGLGTNVIDQMLAQLRVKLQAAAQEMENIRVLYQGLHGQPLPSIGVPATGPPLWRVEQIRHHLQILHRNLEIFQLGLAHFTSDPAMAQNPDVVALQQTANDLRGQAERFEVNLGQRTEGENSVIRTEPAGEAASGDSISSMPDLMPLRSSRQPQQDAVTAPSANHSPELFILSSPQGPVGILFNERRAYTTAPMVSTLPFQTFTQQFAANRQLLAGLGQQTARDTPQMQVPNPVAQQTMNQQPPAAAQPAAAPVVPNQLLPNQPRVLPVPEEDRVAIWAGHAWLIVKLACLMYIFGGGGGWYRPLMMGIAGIIIYLAQLGVFENQFEGIRRHFEALLPLVDRQAQERNRQGQNGNGHAQGQGQQPLRPDRNLRPEMVARRLVRQQQEQSWIRQQMRSAERGLALFVASLWPGIGERMVHAQEERERAERTAQEEAQRLEEERREQEEAQRAEQNKETTASEPKTEPSDEAVDPVEASGSSSKGKEKIEVAEEGLSAS